MLKQLKFLVLLATVSCGYTSNPNSVSTGKVTYNIINNINSNGNVINNIISTNNPTTSFSNNMINNTANNNNYINNIEYNITNNLNNNNSSFLNNINGVLNKTNNAKNKTFNNKKRNREKHIIKKKLINNSVINNTKYSGELSPEKYYNILFGNNNENYYYESIEQYINSDNITNLNSNKYIIDAYKIFTLFIENLRCAIYEHDYNVNYQDNIDITLYDLKRYAILFDKFKFRKKVRNSYNNSLSFLSKYIRTQTQYGISINEFHNYIANKTAELYDQTINALITSIENFEPSYKQEKIIVDSRKVLEYITVGLMNTERDLNNRYYFQNSKLKNKHGLRDNIVSPYDEDRIWVIAEQLDVDRKFVKLEANLITKLNKYNNELMVFLDKITNVDKNKDIVINGINDIKVKNNINNLFKKLNIENYSNYKEIKDFFTNDSLNIKTKEYFELFKQHSSNLKNILVSKIIEKQKNNMFNKTSLDDPNKFKLLIEQNLFDSILYPYFKIIKNTLKNIIVDKSIMSNNNSTINAYTFYFNTKLGIHYLV